MKKRHKETNQVDESWLLTYADSITLLMAFFVLLLSVSSIDQSKVEAIQSGIDNAFSRTESEQPFSSMQEKLNDIVEQKELQDKISITPDALGMHLRFSSRILFKLGSAELRDEIFPVFNSVVNAIKESKFKDYIVKVEGHTDNIPIRTKSYQSNWELSAHRATNVVKYFISQGIEKKRIRAIAMADSFPLYPNITESGNPDKKNQAKNRRIEIYIHRNFK
jgi:chemotaxis protein MotB